MPLQLACARVFASGAEKRVKFLVKHDKLAHRYIFRADEVREREREPSARASSPVDLADIKEVMSRTRDGRKYAGLPPAKFFEKFEIDRSLDKDARPRAATSYKQAHNFSKLFAK